MVIENRVFARRLAAAAAGAPIEGAPESVVNLRFYLLPGNEASRALLSWPALQAGVQFSLDQGVTWQSFSATLGNKDAPASWIPVPGKVICAGDPDGTLGPFPPHNRATLYLRVLPPAEAAPSGLYTFSIGLDFDVI